MFWGPGKADQARSFELSPVYTSCEDQMLAHVTPGVEIRGLINVVVNAGSLSVRCAIFLWGPPLETCSSTSFTHPSFPFLFRDIVYNMPKILIEAVISVFGLLFYETRFSVLRFLQRESAL